jgi:Reverse transcriptase (RNA-dependent DNA polymerase)
LTFLSKLTERVVKSRLTEYLTDNNLLNSHQYIKSHSTESALLSVHDHIIKAMSLQKVTALTLLDLSAAFDTIDHSILLERLSSWFRITTTALAWLKPYLHNRSFYVITDNSKSSSYQFLFASRDGLVVSVLASSAKSARGHKHKSRSDQSLTSLGVTV